MSVKHDSKTNWPREVTCSSESAKAARAETNSPHIAANNPVLPGGSWLLHVNVDRRNPELLAQCPHLASLCEKGKTLFFVFKFKKPMHSHIYNFE